MGALSESSQRASVTAAPVDPLTPVSQPGRLRSWYRQHTTGFLTVVSLVGGLAVWEIVGHTVSHLEFVPLESVWDAFTTQVKSGALGQDVAVSGETFIIGLLLAAVGGIIIGALMATSRVLYDLLDPWVSALRSTPLITLAPLFIVTFGISTLGRVPVVVLISIFPIIVNTADGMRRTDPALIECARSFNAKRVVIYTRVLFPSSLPFIVSGLRLGISQALIGVVVAEFFGSSAGVGYMVFQAAQSFNVGTVFMGVIILAAVGTILSKLMTALERAVAPWRDLGVSGAGK